MRTTLRFGQWLTLASVSTLLVISSACSDGGSDDTTPPVEDIAPSNDVPLALPDEGSVDGAVADTTAPKPPPVDETPWSTDDCADAIQGTGKVVGKIAHDFVQPDQTGNPLRLHDFCDRVVLIAGAAYW